MFNKYQTPLCEVSGMDYESAILAASVTGNSPEDWVDGTDNWFENV